MESEEDMALFNVIQNMIDAGTGQLVTWVTGILPQVFLFLILLNALTRMIGRSRVERLAEKCGSNALLRYMVLPFLFFLHTARNSGIHVIQDSLFFVNI